MSNSLALKIASLVLVLTFVIQPSYAQAAGQRCAIDGDCGENETCVGAELRNVVNDCQTTQDCIDELSPTIPANRLVCEQALQMCHRIVEGTCQAKDEPAAADDDGSSDQDDAALANKTLLGKIKKLDPIKTTPQKLIGRVIKAALGISGSIALIIIIYSGVMWMLARGRSDLATKAKDTILWAIFGLAIIFASYAIADFVINAVQV